MGKGLPDCEKCQGLGFTQIQGSRYQCECVTRRKVQIYLQGLSPATPVPHLTGILDKVTHEGDVLLRAPAELSDPAQVRWVFAYMLLRGGTRRTYECLSAQEIVQINFGEHDRYDRPGHVSQDILALWYGFHEPKNSMLGDLLCSTLDIRSARGKKNWILLRGAPTFGKVVEDYARNRNYEIVSLARGGRIEGERAKPRATRPAPRDPEARLDQKRQEKKKTLI